MISKSLLISAKQNRILNEIAENETLVNHSEVFRFLIDNYKKKSNEPVISNNKPAAIQMVSNPAIKRDAKIIREALAIVGSLSDARAMAEIAFILEGEDESA